MQTSSIRFSLRAMLIAVAACAAVAWLVGRVHSKILFNAEEPEFLRAAFHGARLKIYHAFTPIFVAVASLGAFSFVRAVQRISRSERAVSELLLVLPALTLLCSPIADGTVELALLAITLAAPWGALLLQADEPRRLGYPIAINTAWIVCLACYVYLVLQHASEM